MLSKGFLSVSLTLICAGLSAATVGWRTDNSGSYDVEKAPVTWSDTDNVVWRQKMPAWSNTSPVIIGDKIITCAEPATLICTDKKTGKILWQGSNEYKDLADPAEADKIAASVKEAAPLFEKLKQVDGKARKLQRQLRKDRDNETLKKEFAALKEEQKSLKEKINSNPLAAKYALPKTHDANGFCSYIPVSDGTFVYAAYGIGTLVCYDLSGKRIWGVIGEKPQANFGGSTSPVLSGDLIISGFKDYVAYDTKTGAERWRVAMKAQSYGTPIIIDLGGDDVIITPQGVAIKAKDGSILDDKLFTSTPYNAPIFHDGIIYVVGGKQTECAAIKAPQSVTGEFEKLWTATVPNDRYYGSPLLHDGLLYVIHRNGMLSILDSTDGSIIKSTAIKGMKGKSVYTSPTFAAGNVYLGDEDGLVVVLKAGKEAEELTRNNNEGTRCNPVFEGSKMYMRTNDHLVCVQAP